MGSFCVDNYKMRQPILTKIVKSKVIAHIKENALK